MKTIDKSYCGFCSSESCNYREKPCPTYCVKCGARELTTACMAAGLDGCGYMCNACLDKEIKEHQAAREGLLAGMA